MSSSTMDVKDQFSDFFKQNSYPEWKFYRKTYIFHMAKILPEILTGAKPI